ncbi:MAG TPA: hypothetical protein VFZ25_12280 [Chloroflexota bacterium]|nr:hypothetical protein [Chloroflexota bacterium]
MPRKRVLIPLIFLAALIALVACNGQAAPPDQRFSSPPAVTGTPADVPTGTPTAAATAPAAATPTQSVATRVIQPTVGGTIAVPTRHVEPAATGTLVAQNPQIEIITASPQHQLIAAGETVGVTPINNSITVMIHYSVPLGSTASGSFQPYPYTISVDPPDWRPEVRNPPNAQTLHFELVGSAPGPHVVTVTVPQLGPPVQFTLDIATTGLTPVATGTVVPTAGPVGRLPGEPALTIDDNGKTITLHKGEQFLLRLPEGYNWKVSIANPAIVSYATGFAAPGGASGLYVAKETGQTTFSATGDPICRSANPPCALPSRLFQVTIVVQ